MSTKITTNRPACKSDDSNQSSVNESQEVSFDTLPDSAFVREAQLVKRRKQKNTLATLPFSAPTLWRLVKQGKFPRPVKLSERVTAWKVGDIRTWMAKQTSSSASVLAAEGQDK